MMPGEEGSGRRRRRRTHLLLPVAVLLALFGIALALVPPGFDAGWLLYAQDDPELLADRVVANTLTPDVVQREVATALDAGDVELAQSFAALASERGFVLDAPLAARLEADAKAAASLSHQAGVFAHGLITGEPDDMVGLAGTAVGDLFVFGDVRDAVREGVRYVKGEAADELVLGLACVGLAITAGTYATAGAGTPARVGLSLVKAARKTGRLGARLGSWIGRSLREVVDTTALRQAGASLAAPAVAVRAAREAVKLDKAGRLVDLAGDFGRVQAKAGTRATMEGLRIAESPRDVKRLARLAEAKGGKTRAILKLAGRAALTLTMAALDLASWLFAAVMAVWGFCSAIKSTTERSTRRVLHWRKRRRQRRLAAANAMAARASAVQPSAAPASAHSMTTSHGGACHMNKSKNAAAATAKSIGRAMPEIHTG
jgi:hypothetical protein